MQVFEEGITDVFRDPQDGLLWVCRYDINYVPSREAPQYYILSARDQLEQLPITEIDDRGLHVFLDEFRAEQGLTIDRRLADTHGRAWRPLGDAVSRGMELVRVSYYVSPERLSLTPTRINPALQDFDFYPEFAIMILLNSSSTEFKEALYRAFQRARELPQEDQSQHRPPTRDLGQFLDQIRSDTQGRYFRSESGVARSKLASYHALIQKLEALGYFRYTAPNQVPLARQIILESGDLWLKETRRYYDLDAEDLEERGIEDFLREIGDFLGRIGLPVRSFEEHLRQGESYGININGSAFRIWDSKDMGSVDLWYIVTIRTLGAINTLLRESGSCERAYFVYNTGNDVEVIFLTDAMFEVIRDSQLFSEGLIPRRAGELGPEKAGT
jgi:hypothetical protein